MALDETHRVPLQKTQYDQTIAVDPAAYPITMQVNAEEQTFLTLTREHSPPGFIGTLLGKWKSLIAGNVPGVCFERTQEGQVTLAQNVYAGNQTRRPA